MRLKLLMTVLSIAISLPSTAQSYLSQTEEIQNETPDAIEKIVSESEGNVEIIVDDELKNKILTPPESHKRQNNDHQGARPGINKMQGYRIQVFSDGRNQHSLESRAKARGNAIIAKFPNYRGQVYTFSSSPNWYTRVGNFRTSGEANEALDQLKRAFPSFANEMRIVKCQIVIIR